MNVPMVSIYSMTVSPPLPETLLGPWKLPSYQTDGFDNDCCNYP